MEIWRIENFCPVPIPKSSYGKFFTGDSYIILKTTALKSGAFRHDIHYWLGKDTSQDEAGTVAIKTVELDAALGGRAVQYREIQGHETERFLSYFKPCIIPQEGGAASSFKHTEINHQDHVTRLYVCKGKHVVNVPFARSSLNHDDIFILDTKSKIFQFNGSNSSIQERAKALEVVQYIKDTYHEGKCGVSAIEDGRLMADSEAGEFWSFFGGFAPLPRKTATDDDKSTEAFATRLLRIEKGQPEQIQADSLLRELLDTNKCFVLDCGAEVFVWMGRSTSLEERKSASSAAEEILRVSDRPKAHVIRVIEGFETVMFRSKFEAWPQTTEVTVSEDGRGKVAALLKRQGFNVKGLLKADPLKEEPQPYIDCTGSLQVWRVNDQEKTLIPSSEQSKFYSGDCCIFHYTYPGEENEEHLVGMWFGKQSVEFVQCLQGSSRNIDALVKYILIKVSDCVQEERASALSLASKMVEFLKSQAVQARFYEGKEPIQFFSIFQSFIIFKGGVSTGYKKYIADNSIEDETYSEDGVALFRIQGSGPDNMQAIQVELWCYVFTWSGSLTTTVDQDLIERQLDLIKPNLQSKPQKEGSENEQFWNLLGGKCEYSSQRIAKDPESDPHLFSCSFSKDCRSEIFVWVGQQVESKYRIQALNVGEKFLEHDFLLEKLSRETPIYIVMEGSEPNFFTRFFTWDSAKSSMHGNSFQRRLSIVKNGVTPTLDKPKRRTPTSYSGRSSVPDKSQRSRSMSFSPDRVRVRGRSPAFNALAAAFENPNARNLSVPPPVVKKLYPKSGTPESANHAPRSAALAALTSTFETPKATIIPQSIRGSPEVAKPRPEVNAKQNSNSMSNRIGILTIQEDVKEGKGAEDEEGLPIFPYERLKVTSSDPVSDIDVTKRESGPNSMRRGQHQCFFKAVSAPRIVGFSDTRKLGRENK
ncbi:Villin-4 [Acorus calamus]|uniref:Villin-4 n=1 Tax=Acorus calamus TaxID=4465 RepID=A0AAV9EWK2_ACOCL|nr:Villin-4 [Acorus calamus]